jgi:hypothetical protein
MRLARGYSIQAHDVGVLMGMGASRRCDDEDRIVEAAKEHGILDKAQDNAKTSISTLITSLGYDEVRFT